MKDVGVMSILNSIKEAFNEAFNSNKMLLNLTPEMESKISPVRDKWMNKFYFNPNPLELDEKKAVEFVNWIYSLAWLESPKVMIAKSPLHAQKILKDLGKSQIASKFPPSAIGIRNYGWIADWDFFTQIDAMNHEEFNRYKEYSELNIYDSIELENLCILIKMPSVVKSTVHNGIRVPHCEDGPAIEFEDGFKIYFQNGEIVSKKLDIELVKDTNPIKDFIWRSIRKCIWPSTTGRFYIEYNIEKRISTCIRNPIQSSILELLYLPLNDHTNKIMYALNNGAQQR